MHININGYRALRTADFHARATVALEYSRVAIDLDTFMQYRSAFSSTYKVQKSFKLPVDNTAIGGNNLDLIITDNPTDVWGLINFEWLRRELDLTNITPHALDIGLNLASWSEIRTLDIAKRGHVIAPVIAQYAASKKINPAHLLGGTVLTWDQAAEQYFFVETKNTAGNVILLPREQRKSFTFAGDSIQPVPKGLLIIDEHRRPGEDLVWVGPVERNMTADLKNQSAQSLYLPNDIDGIAKAIREHELHFYWIAGDTPALFFSQATSPLHRSLPPLVYTQPMDLGGYPRNSGEYLAEELISIARNLGVRGYSGKTKAELVMLIGEHVATLPPIESRALLFQDLHGGWQDLQTIVKSKSQRDAITIYNTPEQQFSIAMRIIGRSAYVPTTAPSPAGRLNTDGKFSHMLGYEPLDVLSIES